MRDQNTRAMLIEAVIAGGLIAIGIPTGQGPLFALAAVATSMGCNWTNSLAERGFQHWRDRWFTDDGVLNHDIAKALCHAFVNAVRQVEHNWKEHRYYQYLEHKNPEEAKLTMGTLRHLREDGADLFQQPNHLAQVAQQDPQNRVLSLLYQDEFKVSEYLKPALDAFLSGHDDEFIAFVSEQFGSQWVLRFVEILKDPGEEGTRAWRACQLLWQKSLTLGIEQIQRTSTETADTVRWLQAWAQQLKSMPSTQRNPTGQDALEEILLSVHTQVDEIKATTTRMEKKLDEAYVMTLDIKATLAEVVPSLPRQQAQPPTASQDRNRQRMLEGVRMTWITGMLDQSLHGAALIALGLHEEPTMLANPWRLIVQEVDRPAQSLPADTRIMEVYDEAGGGLLILGEPGAGKTTLLLELARELLTRAQADEREPIPVVFNLSSWARQRAPLADWLVEELSLRYRVSRTLGQNWVEHDQLLLLLDGLDEVAATQRGACIQAINAYRQEHNVVPVVLCSRKAEYEAQSTRLTLSKAVVIQPLTSQQVDDYLTQVGLQLEAVRSLLREDQELRELASTPLMLSVLTLAYYGKSVEDIANGGSIEVQRHRIFTGYVRRMFERRNIEIHYTRKQTISWLIWLAQQMKQRGQSEFYLEDLQSDWLSNSRLHQCCTSLVIGLLTFLIMLPVDVVLFENFLFGIRVAYLDAVLAIPFVWLIGSGTLNASSFKRETSFPFFTLNFNEEEKRSKGRPSLVTIFALFFAGLNGLFDGMLVQSLNSFYTWDHGLFYAMFYIVFGTLDQRIQPTENLVWAWTSARSRAANSLVLGGIAGFILGISNAVNYVSNPITFLTTLSFGLMLGFAIGGVIMLMRGFSSKSLDKKEKIKPNQGIWNSFFNSTRLGMWSGLAFGFVIFLFYFLGFYFKVGYLGIDKRFPPHSDLIYGVSDGLSVAYLYGLRNGGFACVQYMMLRVCLWLTKCIPWRYVQFLDYAAKRILLRKVGGGYIFIHRLLLDYFAYLNLEESLDELLAENK